MKKIRTLRIQLTEKCNLRCVFCCHEGTNCSFNIIKDSNVSTLIRACYDTLSIKRVKFTGGEPLLHDGSIKSIMNNCADMIIDWSLVTNATDYRKMKEYLDIPNFDITVSLPVPISENSESYWSITHADKDHVEQYFNNIKETLAYAQRIRRPIKVNYVLCKGLNDSLQQIKEMILLAKNNSNIDLRFLETVVNITNDQDNRMRKYRVTENDFISTIAKLYPSFKKAETNRSHFKIELSDGTRFRLVKFFCNDECYDCPGDKTSLWLTPAGALKKCAFRNQEHRITDWTYSSLCDTLVDIFRV